MSKVHVHIKSTILLILLFLFLSSSCFFASIGLSGLRG